MATDPSFTFISFKDTRFQHRHAMLLAHFVMHLLFSVFLKIFSTIVLQENQTRQKFVWFFKNIIFFILLIYQNPCLL